VIFNEFVLTTESFIRTVTAVEPEWYVLSFEANIRTSNTFWRSRLLEYGGEYFNPQTFPDGEAKIALLRVINKRMGKRFDGDSEPRKRSKKRRET
jgi:pre-mRNA-splicing factor ATP-dependent RNA helicase DHX15/PRP43